VQRQHLRPLRRELVASALGSDHAADLLAAYGASWPPLIHATIDSTLSSAPPPLAASTGANARLMRSMPKKLVSR
jgi:hypothetical protein